MLIVYVVHALSHHAGPAPNLGGDKPSCGENRVGSIGDAAIFSFFGNKIITTGEGGMITTDNIELFERASALRDQAMSADRRYWHFDVGFNYRMTNVQAALGVAQLGKIDRILLRKKEIYELYLKELEGLDGIQLNRTSTWAENVYWMVCLENKSFDEDERDRFMNALRLKGIDSRPYFYPLSLMPPYRSTGLVTPRAMEIYQKGVNLPSYPALTNSDVRYIANQIRDVLGEAG